MSLWGKTDNANNSTIFAAAQVNKTANSTNRTNLYGNSTVSAFITNQAVGQFGIDTTEQATTTGSAHAGWVLKTIGTGYLDTLTITAGGSSYNNADIITVESSTGGANATATLVTNATGGIISTVITNRGNGFDTINPTVSIANSTGGASGGSSATIVPKMGGRAGRTSYETLVAMSSIVSE